MKITRRQLKHIIKEELLRLMEDDYWDLPVSNDPGPGERLGVLPVDDDEEPDPEFRGGVEEAESESVFVPAEPGGYSPVPWQWQPNMSYPPATIEDYPGAGGDEGYWI